MKVSVEGRATSAAYSSTGYVCDERVKADPAQNEGKEQSKGKRNSIQIESAPVAERRLLSILMHSDAFLQKDVDDESRGAGQKGDSGSKSGVPLNYFFFFFGFLAQVMFGRRTERWRMQRRKRTNAIGRRVAFKKPA